MGFGERCKLPGGSTAESQSQTHLAIFWARETWLLAGNSFSSVCAHQNVVIEADLAVTFSSGGGGQWPLLPLSAVARGNWHQITQSRNNNTNDSRLINAQRRSRATSILVLLVSKFNKNVQKSLKTAHWTTRSVHNSSETRKPTRPKESTLMPPPGLQIYLRPRVTASFDFLIPKVGRFTPLPCGPLVPICSRIGPFAFQIPCSQVC